MPGADDWVRQRIDFSLLKINSVNTICAFDRLDKRDLSAEIALNGPAPRKKKSSSHESIRPKPGVAASPN